MASIIKKKEARSKKQGNYLNSTINFFGFHKSPISNHQLGFTLVEYLVAITILAGLAGGVLFTLNPFTQVERSRDAQRRQDIQQIKNASEAYYQDTSCYPVEIPFGDEWSENGEIYMTEVPQDPTCGQLGGECYYYITDTESDCPQWNVTFARLSQPDPNALICPLSSLSDTCVPEGYDERWACVMSGAVNCQLIAQSGLSYDIDSGSEPTPTGGAGAIPTPGSGSETYTLGGSSQFNPYLRSMTISPLAVVNPGTSQTFYVNVEDATSDVTDVRIHLFSDNEEQILDLALYSGDGRNGTWAGTISADTYFERYAMAIVGENANNVSRCKVLTPAGEIELDEETIYFGGPEPEIDTICAGINN